MNGIAMTHPVFFDQNGRRARIVNINLMLVFGADQPQRPNFHRVRGSVAIAAASDPLSQGLLGTKFDYEQEADDAPN